ncbi:conjugal transfer protein TraF [Bermanella sp. WJH001]|uniref:conjugal transfer protein TraF n=1 Tax=Bermanella sp. WJH001 TaxID=3048005 RepID=UPI0024BEAAB3|nr:conjugal transfer protein TraF [Bermanella sp. WJH001]MDJ1538157.1 conjugal transfer protein TraF [Bermanella sp. WJH001]
MTKMNHKILLGAAITLASLQQASAVPFAPSDARSMGMGGTGVSSAEVASTVQFNPALLATTREDDHFGLKIPQFSLSVADDGGFIDEAEDFDEESELDTTGQGRTNVDLLSDLLDEATGPLGLEKMQQGIEELKAAQLLPNSAPIAKKTAYDNAATKLTQASEFLDTRLYSRNPSVNGEAGLVVYSGAIADDMDDLNNKALRINGGLNVAGAVPSKKFSMAVHAGAQVTFSGKVKIDPKDTDILRNYSAATSAYLLNIDALQLALTNLDENDSSTFDAVDTAQQAVDNFNYGGAGRPESEGNTAIFVDGELSPEAEDADLDSEIQMIGVAVADVGVTASRVFNIKGHDIAFGITPKLQKISIFDYTQELDSEEEFDSEDFSENQEDYSAFNIDLGAAYQFGAEKQWQAGLVIKNLIGDDYESAEYISSNGVGGAVVSISPMMRAGISHRTSWTKVAFDLDITENDPVAFEDPTQYAAIGGELNVWRIVQLRAGYRANLAGSDQDIMTAGIGISPGPVHLDIGVMANTSDIENEAGIALEFGVEF